MLETLTAVAAAASQAVLAFYGRGLSVEYKGPRDPVTDADRRSNALLVRQLGDAFPGVPVVAEESEPASFAHFRDAPRVFFVDPLDGTKEFIDQNDEFAVMIGLVEATRATAGIVFAPALGLAWVGAIGQGVWCLDTKTETRIPVRVSATGDLARGRIVASRSHRSPRLERALAALAVGEVQHMGSAGLKGARVAEGRAEAYVETSAHTKRWDACAIDALVTAAGGRVSDIRGAPIDYRGPTLANEHGLVVSNGLVHEAILARLARQRS